METPTAPRIAPLEPPFEPAIAEELAKWMPPGAPVPPLGLFRTLSRNLPLAQATRGLGSYFLGRRFSPGMR
ncbi:MAG: hypothetical protein KC466_06710, partial [Myxococcales bacterium]|nr:hypothetical protein [Myxococcales bacterium]